MLNLRLSNAAQSDILDILRWTHGNFGQQARSRYERLIATALKDIAMDPERPGSTARPELGIGVKSYHLRFSRERARHPTGLVHNPRHLILFKLMDLNILGVGRLLHDAMEIERHIPNRYDV